MKNSKQFDRGYVAYQDRESLFSDASIEFTKGWCQAAEEEAEENMDDEEFEY